MQGCVTQGCVSQGCVTQGCVTQGCVMQGCVTQGCVSQGCASHRSAFLSNQILDQWDMPVLRPKITRAHQENHNSYRRTLLFWFSRDGVQVLAAGVGEEGPGAEAKAVGDHSEDVLVEIPDTSCAVGY